MKRLALVLVFGGVTHAAGAPDPERLIARATSERGAYDRAVRIADEVGARLAGSAASARAVAWAEAELKRAGLSNVHTEPVTVEAWTRGADDRVEIIAPYKRSLRMLALGRSPGTPATGITADIVEVDSFEALHALGERARGKIVFYNHAITRSPAFKQYGTIGALRFRGAIEASKVGALAAIVRSIGTGAHRLPHTGATMYDDKVPAIPFAAIAMEDAELLHRALARGPVKIAMHLGSGMRGPVQSANVVGDIVGRSLPKEVVLIGAHLDSWDVGDGALDDGAGIGIVVEAAHLLKDMKPRRTVRVVLFMNEEYGLSGAKAYALAHEAELPLFVAAMEADAGGGAPLGVSMPGTDAARALVAKLARPLAKMTASAVSSADEAGADVSPLHAKGVPVVSIVQDASDYFEWHHTDGDTADKIDADAIGKASAAFAVIAAGLADAEETLPRLPAPPAE